MSDKETLHFKIGLSGTLETKGPEIKISVNDKEFVHSTLPGAELTYFEFDAEVDEGNCNLCIELLNKTANDTVKGDSDEIVSDLLLNIDSVEIDEIELGTIKWTHSDYQPIYPTDYVQNQQKHGNDLSKSIKECVNLGWNGRWNLPFQSPFYIWLLENI